LVDDIRATAYRLLHAADKRRLLDHSVRIRRPKAAAVEIPTHRLRIDDEPRRVVRTKTHGAWRAGLTAEDLELINSRLAESMLALDYP
jgi:hypothetical protein